MLRSVIFGLEFLPDATRTGTYDQLDEPIHGNFVTGGLRHLRAVPQHGNSVGKLGDVRHHVADENDGDISFGAALRQLENGSCIPNR